MSDSSSEGSDLDGQLTHAQLEEMKAVFKLFDFYSHGAIDPKEIRSQMCAMGFEADNRTIYQLIIDLDTDGSQHLEFEELKGLLFNLKLHSPEHQTRETTGALFEFMDHLLPSSRTGRLGRDSLRKMADVLGDPITDEELDVMVQFADRGGKGYVEPEDFYMLLRSCAERAAATVDDISNNAELEKLSSKDVTQEPDDGEPAQYDTPKVAASAVRSRKSRGSVAFGSVTVSTA